MKNIILSTNNLNKKEEIQEILNLPILLPRDFQVDLEVDEVENSFFGNSYKKAFELYSLFVENKIHQENQVFLSDDSGLCIEALNFEPGIYSARYGNTEDKKLNEDERNNLVLSKLKDSLNRKAFFVCNLTLLTSKYDFISVSKILQGSICDKAYGDFGFAYDKIFIPNGYDKTLAFLGKEIKNNISHRSKAIKEIQKFFL